MPNTYPLDVIATLQAGMTRPGMPEHDDDLAVQSAEPALAQPPLYKVVLHNDDYTPMEFVVEVLESVFNRSGAEATRIMLTVHRSGIGVAGIFSSEVAEAKAAKTVRFARESGYPLLCTTEPE